MSSGVFLPKDWYRQCITLWLWLAVRQVILIAHSLLQGAQVQWVVWAVRRLQVEGCSEASWHCFQSSGPRGSCCVLYISSDFVTEDSLAYSQLGYLNF